MSTTEYCTFFVSGVEYGIPVSEVQEVASHQPLTRVPLGPPMVRGLMNLRGEIVTVIDFRRRLGLPERHDNQLAVNMVIRREDGVVSLLVDDVGDVITVANEAVDPPPVTLRGPDRDLVAGVHQRTDRLLILLDTTANLDGCTP